MNALKQRLFTNWHFMRSVRFGFGLSLLVVAILTKDMSSLPFSVFFLFTAIAGLWCSDIHDHYTAEANRTMKKNAAAE